MPARTNIPGVKLHRTWVNRELSLARNFSNNYFDDVCTWMTTPIYYMGTSLHERDFSGLIEQSEYYNDNLLSL